MTAKRESEAVGGVDRGRSGVASPRRYARVPRDRFLLKLGELKSDFVINHDDVAFCSGNWNDEIRDAAADADDIGILDAMAWAAEYSDTDFRFDIIQTWLAALGKDPAPIEDFSLPGDLSLDEGAVLFVEGNLHVHGDFKHRGTVIVCGDLQVDGVAHCYGDDPVSGDVFVLGSARVGSMIMMGGGVVTGTLSVNGPLYGSHSHETGCFVARRLQTPLLVQAELAWIGAVSLEATRHLVGREQIQPRFPALYDSEGNRAFDVGDPRFLAVLRQ